MHVRFWGTRGSIPKPGPTTLRYGGNTSCVEVRTDDGTRLVLDAGSGLHELGLSLLHSGEGAAPGHLLIGHTHWDHIQGFPFFAPFFVPHGHWDIYAPGGRAKQLEGSLSALMSHDHHPITLDALEAEVAFHDLTEGEFQAGSVRVVTQYLHHPALTLGYRLEADGATLVYAADHEPHSLRPRDGDPTEAPIHHEDRRHLSFLAGADLMIHDSQYTLEQFPEKAGWGHAPMERVVDYAIGGDVQCVALFHHDPENDDERIDAIVSRAAERAARGSHVPEVFAAAEGPWLKVTGHGAPQRRAAPRPSALLTGESATAATVLIVDDDAVMRRIVESNLEHEGVRTLVAKSGEEALALASAERPTLIVLDLHMPGLDGFDVCRSLRAEDDPELRDVPILILTGTQLEEEQLAEAFRAGATDFMVKPIKATLLRSRVRGWLMRQRR